MENEDDKIKEMPRPDSVNPEEGIHLPDEAKPEEGIPVPDEVNPEKDMSAPDEVRPEHSVPPSLVGRFSVEEEWAETLGMDFDSEEAAKPTPPPYTEGEQAQKPSQAPVPPIFVMQPSDDVPSPDEMNPEAAYHRKPMPPTYLIWAIVATICCCLPTGIVAIVFSSNVSSKYYARDYEGACRASRKAEIWIIASIVTGIIVNSLYVPLSLMMPS